MWAALPQHMPPKTEDRPRRVRKPRKPVQAKNAVDAKASAPAPTQTDTKAETDIPKTLLKTDEQAQALQDKDASGVKTVLAAADNKTGDEKAKQQEKDARVLAAEVSIAKSETMAKTKAKPRRVLQEFDTSKRGQRYAEQRAAAAKAAAEMAAKKGKPIGAENVQQAFSVTKGWRDGDAEAIARNKVAVGAGLPALTASRVNAFLANPAIQKYFGALDASDPSVFTEAAGHFYEVLKDCEKEAERDRRAILDSIKLQQTEAASAIMEMALHPKLRYHQEVAAYLMRQQFRAGLTMLKGGYKPDFRLENRVSLKIDKKYFDADRPSAVKFPPYHAHMFDIGQAIMEQLALPPGTNLDVIVRKVAVRIKHQSMVERTGETRIVAAGHRESTLRGAWNMELMGDFKSDYMRYIMAIESLPRYKDLSRAGFNKRRDRGGPSDFTAEERNQLREYAKAIEKAAADMKQAASAADEDVAKIEKDASKAKITAMQLKIQDILAKGADAAKKVRSVEKENANFVRMLAKHAGKSGLPRMEENVLLLEPEALIRSSIDGLRMAEKDSQKSVLDEKSFAKHTRKGAGESSTAGTKTTLPAPSVFDQAMFRHLPKITCCDAEPTVIYDWAKSGECAFFAGMNEDEQKALQRDCEVYSTMDFERCMLQHMAAFLLLTEKDDEAVRARKYESYTGIIEPDGQQFWLNAQHGTTPDGHEELMAMLKKALSVRPDAGMSATTTEAQPAAAAAGAGPAAGAPAADAKDSKAELAMAGVTPAQPEKIPDPLTHLGVLLFGKCTRREFIDLWKDAKEAPFNDPLTGNKVKDWEDFVRQRIGHVSETDKRMMFRLNRRYFYAEVKAYSAWLTQYDCIFPVSNLRVALISDRATVLAGERSRERGCVHMSVDIEFHQCTPGALRGRGVARAAV